MISWYDFMTANCFYLFLVGMNSYTKARIHKKSHHFIPSIHTANVFYPFLVGANSCFLYEFIAFSMKYMSEIVV